MQHIKQLYTFTKTPKIISKNDGERIFNVSAKMFINELIDLCNKNVFSAGLKINYHHKNHVTYIFNANQKSKMYNAHTVSSVIINIDSKNIDKNIDNIKILDGLTNDAKNVNTYNTCTDLFEKGVVNGFTIRGFSLGTYSSPKLSVGLSTHINNQYNPTNVMYNPNNVNNFIVFDEKGNDDIFSSVPEKQYVYKN